jgi:uncharacterized damage-inducible protein DinB
MIMEKTGSRLKASRKARKGIRGGGRKNVADEYLGYCRRRLLEEYLPKIKKCVDDLDDDEIWWREHETDNSIGNLILHLSGNIRQWIVTGIGGEEDVRNRPLEFSERRHLPRKKLLEIFEKTLKDADRVLKKFDGEKVLEIRHFQKWDNTCLDAISHVVEHVAQHMGQIIYITKLRKGKDLRLVDV